jgi:hypothetical protein
MSSKFALKSIAVASAGLFIGYTGMTIANNTRESNFANRSVASLPLLKIGADQISRDYFDIKIINEVIADNDSESSILKAIITAKKDLPEGMQYQWKLHKDMNSNDILDGSISALTAGKSTEISLQVVGFSKQINSHINFSVFGELDNHTLHRSVITSSRPEDSFEYIVEKAALHEKETGKVQKLSNGKPVRKKFNLNNVIR